MVGGSGGLLHLTEYWPLIYIDVGSHRCRLNRNDQSNELLTLHDIDSSRINQIADMNTRRA